MKKKMIEEKKGKLKKFFKIQLSQQPTKKKNVKVSECKSNWKNLTKEEFNKKIENWKRLTIEIFETKNKGISLKTYNGNIWKQKEKLNNCG